MNYTSLNKEVIDAIWGRFSSRILLSSALKDSLIEEAKWAKDSGKVSKDTVLPDFNTYLYNYETTLSKSSV